MIWQNPWALLGLAAAAIPLLIHLLGRGAARVHRFPSLRFLTPSRLLPTRRTRLHDPLLLTVRIAILAAAATALAQPLWLSAARARSRNSALARVVIVDTSASMQRTAATGGAALAVARRAARALADSAAPSTIVETAVPGAMLAGASEWLGQQAGRSEIVVLSDFQVGVLSERELAALPRSTGVRLVTVAGAAPDGPIETRARLGDDELVARTTFTPSGTTVEWSTNARPAPGQDVQLLTNASEHAAALAAERAARSVGTPLPTDSVRRVAIVFPSHEQRAALAKGAVLPQSRWMTDVARRLRADPLLAAAVAGASISAAPAAEPDDSQFIHARIVIAAGVNGRPVILAGQDSDRTGSRLLLFSAAPPGSVTAATLVAAVDRARSNASGVRELEPDRVPDSTLARWQRPPASEAPRRAVRGDEGESDGRWLWLAVLALMILETFLRRPRPLAAELPAERIAHDRVA